MASPTVTRPAVSPDLQPGPGGASLPADWVDWIKWIVLGVLAACALGAIVFAVLNQQEKTRVDAVKKEWDEVYNALKVIRKDKDKGEKTTIEENIHALEGVVEKVKGTPAHAYVLSMLGSQYLDIALDDHRRRDERAPALAKATQLFETVATNEPYKSNPAFGPLALQNWAVALEQGNELDKAIQVLSDGLATEAVKNHILVNKLTAQLGRLHWIRSLQKQKAGQDAADDRTAALARLNAAISATTGDTTELFYGDGIKWRQQAEYIRDLLDEPGKLLPGGRAPAPKVKAEERKADEKKPDGEKPADAKAPDAAKPDAAKPADAEKKPDAAPPPAEKKEEKKDEPKKEGFLNRNPMNRNAPQSNGNPVGLSASGAPTQHLSYAEMQKMMKDGKTSFCQCIRCFDVDKAFRAALSE